MGGGFHGGFGKTQGYTLGSTYLSGSDGIDVESYSDRGIEIPEELKVLLGKMPNKGDYVTGTNSDFSMADVSIMSKEAKVEFAKVTLGNKSYVIRGDSKGTVIPENIMDEIKREHGTLEFHSHPHNDDLIPSKADRRLMHTLSQITGQTDSTIITPNGRFCSFDENGTKETGILHSALTEERKQALIEIFGGQEDDK